MLTDADDRCFKLLAKHQKCVLIKLLCKNEVILQIIRMQKTLHVRMLQRILCGSYANDTKHFFRIPK